MKCKVLLWGWFGFSNYGDDLLLKQMISILSSCDTLITLPVNSNISFINDSITQTKRETSALIDKCTIYNHDVLIIGPGGLFPVDDFRYFSFLLRVVLKWKRARKKVIFYGIGITNKLCFKSSIIWKLIINNSDLFFTRNNEFFKTINMKESKKKCYIPDVVFSYKPKYTFVEQKDKVLIAPANLYGEKDAGKYQNCVLIWSKVVKYLLDKGEKIDLVAFTKCSDDNLINDIKESVMSDAVRCIYYSSAENIIDEWSEYKLAICMRFHSLVISALMNCPAVAIAYGHKTINLAEELGQGDYVIKWNDARKGYFGEYNTPKVEDIIEIINRVYNNQDSISEIMEVYKRSFVESAEIAKNHLIDMLQNQYF